MYTELCVRPCDNMLTTLHILSHLLLSTTSMGKLFLYTFTEHSWHFIYGNQMCRGIVHNQFIFQFVVDMGIQKLKSILTPLLNMQSPLRSVCSHQDLFIAPWGYQDWSNVILLSAMCRAFAQEIIP